MNASIASSPSDPYDEIFRLRGCPNCDYSLLALPPDGICPECGNAYTRDCIVLGGYGRGSFDTTWRGMALTAVALAILGVMTWTSNGRNLNVIMIGLGVFLALSLATQLYARVFSAGELHARIWLSPRGVAQRASSEAQNAAAVSGYAFYVILAIALIVSMFPVTRRVGWGTVMVLGIAAAFVIARASRMLTAWWKYHRDAPRASADPPLNPWETIVKMEIDELLSGRHRLILYLLVPMPRSRLTPVVDIELALDARQILRLRDLIQTWSGGRLCCNVNDRP